MQKKLGLFLLSAITFSSLSTQSALALSVDGTHLTGLLKVDPGIKEQTEVVTADGSVIVVTAYTGGSYFVMNQNNPNSGSAAMLRPGTAGGIALGSYNNFVLNPDEPRPTGWKGDIDGDGIPDGLAGTEYDNVPPVYPNGSPVLFSFFGNDTYVGLNPIGYQSGEAHPAPSVEIDMSSCVADVCSITADFSAWEVFWNGSAFEQGPRPDNTGPFGLATGTYNLITNEYNLGWSSQIKGGPFNNVIGFWYIEGTVVPVPAAVWLFGSGLIALIGFGRNKKPA